MAKEDIAEREPHRVQRFGTGRVGGGIEPAEVPVGHAGYPVLDGVVVRRVGWRSGPGLAGAVQGVKATLVT